MMPRHTMPLVYLGSRYSRREELQGYAQQLRDLGVARVDCRWLSEPHDWDGGTTGDSLAAAQRFALDDAQDLERAHAAVIFTEPAGEYRRGGSLVELGIAIAQQKHVVIVGPAPNVFCTLPFIFRCNAWPDAVAHLLAWRTSVEQADVRRRLMA